MACNTEESMGIAENQLDSSKRIAFLIWNTFQLLHFRSLLLQLPTALLVVEQRKRSIPIAQNILAEIPNNVAYIAQKDIQKKLDGKFDVLVIQTVFEQIDLFKETKIAMLQYGYAKAPHNYGTWRAFADLNLVYGQHAYDAISYFSPTESIGCPRYDQWFDVHFHLQSYYKYASILDNSKKTILYAPSWGELSSFHFYIDQLYALSERYNVIVKIHHNTTLLSNTSHNLQDLFFGVHFFYENEDIISLISIADIVISDFSGAIFDALFCRKPVVLLNIPNSVKSQKLDAFSLEIFLRSQLGTEIHSPEELGSVLDEIAAAPQKYQLAQELYANLFTETEYATKQAVYCLNKLANGDYVPSQQQQYIRQTLCELYAEKRKGAEKRKSFSKMKQLSKKLLLAK